jgi:hypothetical protein
MAEPLIELPVLRAIFDATAVFIVFYLAACGGRDGILSASNVSASYRRS